MGQDQIPEELDDMLMMSLNCLNQVCWIKRIFKTCRVSYHCTKLYIFLLWKKVFCEPFEMSLYVKYGPSTISWWSLTLLFCGSVVMFSTVHVICNDCWHTSLIKIFCSFCVFIQSLIVNNLTQDEINYIHVFLMLS